MYLDKKSFIFFYGYAKMFTAKGLQQYFPQTRMKSAGLRVIF